jgi:hypothetical protein
MWLGGDRPVSSERKGGISGRADKSHDCGEQGACLGGDAQLLVLITITTVCTWALYCRWFVAAGCLWKYRDLLRQSIYQRMGLFMIYQVLRAVYSPRFHVDMMKVHQGDVSVGNKGGPTLIQSTGGLHLIILSITWRSRLQATCTRN